MVEIRKIVTMRELVLSELGVAAPRPVVRAVGMAVIRNPFAGRFVDDLQPLFEAGAMLGERLMPDLVKLPCPHRCSYRYRAANPRNCRLPRNCNQHTGGGENGAVAFA